MSVEDLHLPENRVCDDDACGCLADEPVTGGDVNWGAVQGVGMYSCSNDWETGEYDEACS